MPFSTVILLVLVVLVALAVIAAALLFGYLYAWLISRAQPKTSGELHVPGLAARVEVRRDKHGIPHILAANRADLFRAQGFVHAQDRFWQMEQNRRVARGTLAEVFGEAALDVDRFSRTVGFLRAAEADLAALAEPARQTLEWYSEGVTAYLRLRPRRVAAELNLLRLTPQDWTPLDSLALAKVIAWGLSANWESELTRLRLLAEGSPYRVAELEPDLPADTPRIAEAAGGPTQQRLIHVSGLLLNFLEPLKVWVGAVQGGQGSNAWVVAPGRSLTRKPILANDLHLPAQIPGIWYEQHLTAPDFEVVGAGFPGTPGVVAGHNEELAWGLTNAAVDQSDLYIEQPHPERPDCFAFGEAWEDARVLEESIRVRRREQPHVERVTITRHGPVITNLLPTSARAPLPVLSARWVGHAPSHLMEALLGLNDAETIEEATEALRQWDVPAQNVLLADVRGNIAWRLAGRIPRRENHLGATPGLGWTGSDEWSGFIPFEELPRLDNPPSGVIVTANNKPVGDEYPYYLGLEFDAGWRAARIEQLLAERERFSVRDIEDIQLDTQSLFAAQLVRWIVLINSADPWEKTAIQSLRKWNLRMDPDSTPALVFHHVLIELLAMVFGDKLGATTAAYYGGSVSPIFPFSSHMDRAQGKLLELLDANEASAWYTDVASGVRRDRDQLLQEALTRAVRRIRDSLGDSALRWQWGRVHQVSYQHPLGSARFLGNIFNRGPIPIGGDNTTVLQTRYTPQSPIGMVQVIPTWRAIFEVGAWERMQSVTPTGQSGHPLSETYDDQIAMWREGVYHTMAWRRETVEKVTVSQLALSPLDAT